MNIAFIGLSIRSSWGNGHATTYRSLIDGLVRRHHRVTFLECDAPWFADHADLPRLSRAQLHIYSDFAQLRARYTSLIKHADVVIIGSFTQQGVAVGRWVLDTALGVRIFYDIDTPVTLNKLEIDDRQYIARDMMPRFDLYLSFTGGPMLDRLRSYGVQRPRPLYCSANPDFYYPEHQRAVWDLGYMGTYSKDRAAALTKLLLEPAKRFGGKMVVAGSLYPRTCRWPSNVERIDHAPPTMHRRLYNSMRFALNLTRALMKRDGYSPSVRMFEAAACGCPMITDEWKGLDRFFSPGEEILVARTSHDVLAYLRELRGSESAALGRRARARVLEEHSGSVRARELERYIDEFQTGDGCRADGYSAAAL